MYSLDCLKMSEIEVVLLAMMHELTAIAFSFDELNREPLGDAVVLKVKQALNYDDCDDRTMVRDFENAQS